MHWSSDDDGDSDLDAESFESGQVFPFPEEMKQQYIVVVKDETEDMLKRVVLHTYVAIFYMLGSILMYLHKLLMTGVPNGKTVRFQCQKDYYQKIRRKFLSNLR